ncbi:exodeoxyribonuclease VII large subunit [Salicibibacter cibarius]|uniref:Exodeoxyribonuclease 7 large subunit n=2 Tax=Salicibibacter cibarius TaxID=2743000 RepID=A0A7T6Z2W0_9BACI|nr:exodeoxyribonuclease VII large subunit [Salicibibacter cibarius]QQK75925.1 exodeoxyribonuclease VII large subunit [Salicibibacter cibarius]
MMNPEQRYLSVTQLTRQIKGLIDKSPLLNDVFLRGEISNFKHHSRGHMYFTIKDEKARVSAVMFAGNNRALRFRPESGMKVLVRGNVSVYEPYGQYQLYVRMMEPDGIGQLYLAYEQLKKKLDSEGLFHASRKRPLPNFPDHIGVITSKTGAVIRDIYTTVKRRYPQASISLYPVAVQGPEAAPGIVRALKQANEDGNDVLIAGRGGGSIEDLWAFNDEQVVRTAAALSTPLISAVGHETDVTLMDFVADIRAATPTAAAEIAVPSLIEWQQKIATQKTRLQQIMQQIINARKEKLAYMKNAYAFRYPEQLLKQKEQELDRNLDQLHRAMQTRMQMQRQQVNEQRRRIASLKPTHLLEQKRKLLETDTKQLEGNFQRLLADKANRYERLLEKLTLLNPMETLKRGYTVAYRDEQLVKTVEAVDLEDELRLYFQDGYVKAEVTEKGTETFVADKGDATGGR